MTTSHKINFEETPKIVNKLHPISKKIIIFFFQLSFKRLYQTITGKKQPEIV
jgi:predicted AAA+ superfamily ATPase